MREFLGEIKIGEKDKKKERWEKKRRKVKKISTESEEGGGRAEKNIKRKIKPTGGEMDYRGETLDSREKAEEIIKEIASLEEDKENLSALAEEAVKLANRIQDSQNPKEQKNLLQQLRNVYERKKEEREKAAEEERKRESSNKKKEEQEEKTESEKESNGQAEAEAKSGAAEAGEDKKNKEEEINSIRREIRELENDLRAAEKAVERKKNQKIEERIEDNKRRIQELNDRLDVLESENIQFLDLGASYQGVILKKINKKPLKETGVDTGEEFSGTLFNSRIDIGDIIDFTADGEDGDSIRTSCVKEIKKCKDGTYIIETETSFYRLTILEKNFSEGKSEEKSKGVSADKEKKPAAGETGETREERGEEEIKGAEESEKIIESTGTMEKEKGGGLVSEQLAVDEVDKIKDYIRGLNFSREDLNSIEGFNELSEGQQFLVLENLRQLTLGRIKEEARGKYREKQESSESWRKKMWRNITKKYQIAKLEKATAFEILGPGEGIEQRRQILTQLAKEAAEGPEVKVGEDGRLEIQYASYFENLDDSYKENVDEFNKIATEFSRTPYEWAAEEASGKNWRKYKSIEKKYREALGGILRNKKFSLSLDGNLRSDMEASLYVNNIDRQVMLNQFFNTSPDVEKEFLRIKNNKIIQRALTDIATERGFYGAFGFVTRQFTVSLLGLAGAPLAAGLVGGFVARNRAKEGLKEKDELSRRGESKSRWESRELTEDDLKKEKYYIPNVGEKKKEISSKLLEAMKETKTKGGQLLGVKENKGVKDFVKAEDLIELLDGLVWLINKEKGKAEIEWAQEQEEEEARKLRSKREELYRHLDFNLQGALIELNRRRVDFGDKDRRLENQYNLIKKMAEAEIVLQSLDSKFFADELEGAKYGEELKIINEFLEGQEEKLNKERRSYLLKQIGKGAAISATFAVAGWFLRHLAGQWLGEGKTGTINETERVGGKAGSSTEAVAKSGEKIGDSSASVKKGIVGKTEANKSSSAAPKSAAESPASQSIADYEKNKEAVKKDIDLFHKARFHVPYQGGKSVWQESEKQLAARFKDRFAEYAKGDPKVAKALKIYNIDRLKDVIVANPEKYGLPEDVNWNKMSEAQLRGINWDEAFKKAFPENRPVDGLRQDQIDSILKGGGRREGADKIIRDLHSQQLSDNIENLDKKIQVGEITDSLRQYDVNTNLGEEIMKGAGIDSEKLDFWQKNTDYFPSGNPKQIMNFFDLTKEAGVGYNRQETLAAFRSIPEELLKSGNKEMAVNYLKALAGDSAQRQIGFSNLFGLERRGIELINRQDGSMMLTYRYGKNFRDSLDILIANNKIGIDGPGEKMDWGVEQDWLGAKRPVMNFNKENLQAARGVIKKMISEAEDVKQGLGRHSRW